MFIETQALRIALQNLTRNSSARRSAMPILWNVLISPHPEGVTLQMTDLDTWICLPVAATPTDFTTTVPAKMLLEIVNLLGKESPKLEIIQNVRSSRVTLNWTTNSARAGSRGTATLTSWGASEFPALPRADAQWSQMMTITGQRLAELSASVVVAAQKAKDGQVFECVLFNKNEATATDRAMMAIGSMDAESPSLLISANSLRVAANILGEVDVVEVWTDSDNTELRFTGAGRMVQTPIVDLRFPDMTAYRRISFNLELRVDRDALANALRLCKVCSPKTIKFWIEKGLAGISAAAIDERGRSSGEMEVELGSVSRCPAGSHSHTLSLEKFGGIVNAIPSGPIAIRWEVEGYILLFESIDHPNCRYFLATFKR